MRRSRPASSRPPRARLAGASFNCATIDGDTSTNDSFVHRRHRQGTDAADSRRERSALRGGLRRAARGGDRARAGDRPRRRRRDQVHHARSRRRARRRRVPARRIRDRAFAARQDARSSRRIPISAASSARSATRQLPTSIRRACRSRSTTCGSWTNGARAASYTEEDGQRVMKERRDHCPRDARTRRARRRPSGPATFRTTTSASTPTTAADALRARSRSSRPAPRRNSRASRRPAPGGACAHRLGRPRLSLAQARGPRIPRSLCCIRTRYGSTISSPSTSRST